MQGLLCCPEQIILWLEESLVQTLQSMKGKKQNEKVSAVEMELIVQEPCIKTDLKEILTMFKAFKYLKEGCGKNRILGKRKRISS